MKPPKRPCNTNDAIEAIQRRIAYERKIRAIIRGTSYKNSPEVEEFRRQQQDKAKNSIKAARQIFTMQHT